MLINSELTVEELEKRKVWLHRLLNVVGVTLIGTGSAFILYYIGLFLISDLFKQRFVWINIGCFVVALYCVLKGRNAWAYGVALLTVPIACTIAFLISLALSRSPHQTRAWTEDVLLEDGTTIQVKRTVAFTESDSATHEAYNAVETDATISFTGQLANLPPWRAPLMALVMYQDKTTNEWVVVAISSSCEIWNQRGKPRPPYWEFRLGAKGWREASLSPASIGRSGNLLHRYQKQLDTQLITIEERKKLEVPGRPFESMSPTEKKYWIVMSEVSPYNC